jgi:hypothetical protein
MQFMTSFPFASIENECLRVDYLTTTGPRIIGLYAKGVEGNLLAETPEVHWPTPHGEYILHGGHRLWIAPENPFYICPEDGIDIQAENNKVTLKSPIDASGLQKEITFQLHQHSLQLTHLITWHGKAPMEFAPWSITQLRLGGLGIMPQPVSDGLQPNRNLVFWPYSQINDERLELHDDFILIHGRASEQAFKIGHYNTHGWIACAFGNVLFIKKFRAETTEKYPDFGCNVEAYVRESCLELETLGPLTRMMPNESVTHEETWEVVVGEYPTTLENARTIVKQLSILHESDS